MPNSEGCWAQVPMHNRNLNPMFPAKVRPIFDCERDLPMLTPTLRADREKADPLRETDQPRKAWHRCVFKILKLRAGRLLLSAFGLVMHCSNFRFANENTWFKVLFTKIQTVEMTNTRAESTTHMSEFRKQNTKNAFGKSTHLREFSKYWTLHVWKMWKTRARQRPKRNIYVLKTSFTKANWIVCQWKTLMLELLKMGASTGSRTFVLRVFFNTWKR